MARQLVQRRGGAPREIAPHRVAAMVGPTAAAFELGVVQEVFGFDRSELVDPWYDLRVVTSTDGPVAVGGGGWSISTPWTLRDAADADTLIVPVWPGGATISDEVLELVRAVHHRGGRVVSVCSGAFVLAEAGVLDGRRATTHWMHADALAARYPAVEVDPRVLFVDGGDGVFTSAGTAAGIDLCLHLVRLDHGAAVANAVARRMVVPPQRAGGQAQFVDPPVPAAAADDTIDRTMAWAIARLDRPTTVDDLAREALMSPRTYARRFRAVTGTTPMRWLGRQRILHAQRLLETTDLPVDHVATACGFGTAAALRIQFRRVAGTTPMAYRRAFCGEPEPTPAGVREVLHVEAGTPSPATGTTPEPVGA